MPHVTNDTAHRGIPPTAATIDLDLLNPAMNSSQLDAIPVAPGLDFVFIQPRRGADSDPSRPNQFPEASSRGACSSTLLDTVRLLGKDAIGGFAIEEVSQGGSVPFLRAKNDSEFHILLIAGQMVKGGKQNRGINADMVIKPGSTAEIPVTCVEQGRWSTGARGRYQHGAFDHGGFEPSFLRASKMRDVHESRRASRPPVASQSAVWGSIHEMATALRADSRSSDLLESLGKVRARRNQTSRGQPDAGTTPQPNMNIDGTPVLGAGREMLMREIEMLEHDVAECMQQSRAVGERLRGALDAGDFEAATHENGALRQALQRVDRLRQRLVEARFHLAHMPGGEAERPDATTEPHAPIDSAALDAADEAAKRASGLLVFANGELLAGDLFAQPGWFASVYGDLRESALATWELLSHRAARRGIAMRDNTATLAHDTARRILDDTFAGRWVERRAVAHERAFLLEHADIESAVVGTGDGTPLHLLVGTRMAHTLLRR
jgi:hypothetical protein